MYSRTIQAAHAVAVAVLLTAGGAGVRAQGIANRVGDIQGTVTFKGKPLPAGTIGFHPAQGKLVVGQLRRDGTFSVKNVPAGRVRVTVETESVKAPAKAPPGKPPAAGKYVPIPARYGDPKTSALAFEVQGGENTLIVNLQ